ncbi:MAG: RCC1 domain-containing protein, partial [Longimicrobiaceae bacterium]
MLRLRFRPESRALHLLALLLVGGCAERELPTVQATSETPRLAIAEDVEIVEGTITAGGSHSCGISVTGVAYCWGSNARGPLGDGTRINRLAPVAVQMPPGVQFVAISAGAHHTVALSTTGAAYTWGGLIGDGETRRQLVPVPVRMPSGVSFVAIAAGDYHTVALSATGAAYAWGSNGSGELGDGTGTNSLDPVAVQMLQGVSFARVGAGSFSVALSTEGAAYAWGYNGYGQLGDGTDVDRGTPVAVLMPPGVRFSAISAGAIHTVALATSGAAYAWGNGAYGKLGNGSLSNAYAPVPVQMPGGVSFAALDAGGQHSMAISTAGAAYGGTTTPAWWATAPPAAASLRRRRRVGSSSSKRPPARSASGAT